MAIASYYSLARRIYINLGPDVNFVQTGTVFVSVVLATAAGKVSIKNIYENFHEAVWLNVKDILRYVTKYII